MNKSKLKVGVFLLLCSSAVFAGEDTHVGKAVSNSAQASGNASGSAAHAIAASGQLTSAMVAVPLLSGGVLMSTAGVGSIAAGDVSLRAASAPIGTPLKITDETITTMPPNQALKNKKEDKQ